MLIMRLLTYNIDNDTRDATGRAIRLAALCERENVDVIALQELTPDFLTAFAAAAPSFTIYAPTLMSKTAWYGLGIAFSPRVSTTNLPTFTPFTCTGMGRGYLTTKLGTPDCLTLVTTHLESGPGSSATRAHQSAQLAHELASSSLLLLVEDTNFTQPGESLPTPLVEVGNTSLHSYDASINKRATPPFRSRLDRIYMAGCTSVGHPVHVDTRLVDAGDISDHFGVLAIITV